MFEIKIIKLVALDLDRLRVIKIIAARNYWLKDGLVFGSEVRFWT